MRPTHVGALAGTAAAVASAVTILTTPPHHVARPAEGRITGVTSGAAPAPSVTGAGSTAPSVTGAAGTAPSLTGGTARASATSGASAMPTSAATQARASKAASAAASTIPVSGELSISPATLDVVPPAPGTITLTASGGPVDWSVSEPPGLTKKVVVSPMSGTLADHATTTVSVAVDGRGKMHVHLVFSPGGTTVTVVVS
jgi:hypothetical protein